MQPPLRSLCKRICLSLSQEPFAQLILSEDITVWRYQNTRLNRTQHNTATYHRASAPGITISLDLGYLSCNAAIPRRKKKRTMLGIRGLRGCGSEINPEKQGSCLIGWKIGELNNWGGGPFFPRGRGCERNKVGR